MLVFILSALAVCVLGAYISSKNKVNIGDGLAMSASGLILALYVLAFFRAMKLVWIVALVAIVFVLVSEISARKKSVSDKDGNVLSLVLLSMFVITVTVVGAMVSGNVFSWWDDINFWSSDAKQLVNMAMFLLNLEIIRQLPRSLSGSFCSWVMVNTKKDFSLPDILH